MKFSQILCPTLKEDPHDAEIISHKLLFRAGFIRKIAQGIYAYLPLGLRVIQKLEAIIRSEMNRAGAQEVFMPSMIPAELWMESGRWEKYGKELLRMKDRHGKEFCYGPTHEEVITTLVKNNMRSYKQLPANFYQIQTKFRDEIRPRFGLMRGREFTMKDAYSFHSSYEDLDKTYTVMQDTYYRIFERCGLKAKAVEADSGNIGGNTSAEFMVLAQTGEDEIASCNDCGYTANTEAAETLDIDTIQEKIDLISELKTIYNQAESLLSPYQLVSTPHVKTIEDLCNFFKTSADQFIKTLIYLADDKPVMVLLRGDTQANEVKLAKILGCERLVMANDATVREITGADPGFAGPIGLAKPCPVYADFTVKYIKNAITGANKTNTHLTGVYPNRDFSPIGYFDLRLAQEQDICPRCKTGRLTLLRGIEVGHIFKLGEKYSKAMSATFLDIDGQEKPYIMGCYGIGVGRTMSAAIEQNHDENGIIWPMALAPYSVDLILVNSKEEDLCAYASNLYQRLKAADIEVIYDDRPETAGIKFKDADLIGFPIQIIIGKRFRTEGLIEIRQRKTKESQIVSDMDVLQVVQQLIANGS